MVLNSKLEKIISSGALVHILVVDDFDPWRRFISTKLQEQRHFQIIGVALDGLDAIQKAEELQPDLILMDFGLPKLNGIEAARQIFKLVPNSKILFTSQHLDPDLALAALGTGAGGFVTKSDAGKELLTAVAAVMSGKQYVSRRLAGHFFAQFGDAQGPNHLHRKESTIPLPARGAERELRHKLQFYSDDAGFLDSFVRFVETALRANNAVIVVATELRRERLFQRLLVQGIDVWAAVERGSYISLDAAETLSTFMVNDMPDAGRFLRVVGDLVATAAKRTNGEPRRVAACGECAPLLWASKNGVAAVRLEQLWNEVAKSYDVDILCGYPLSGFDREEHGLICHRICAEHSTVCSC